MAVYQWYPGHMTKARRMMQENIRLVDLVIELCDARAPISSRNPDIAVLAKDKKTIVVLGKSDLADPAATRRFLDDYAAQGVAAVSMDSRDHKAAAKIRQSVMTLMQDKIAKDRQRGIVNRPIRAMVAGIPNTGKSTLINSLAGSARAKTGNQPGVTKGKQWISVQLGNTRTNPSKNLQMDLLDTPGILWPKIEDEKTGVRLALLGSIRNEVLDEEDLACHLLSFLQTAYPDEAEKRYPGIFTGTDDKDRQGEAPRTAPATALPGENNRQELEALAKKRGLLLTGGTPDIQRAAHMLLDDFRSGRIGRITLDPVPAVSQY